MVQAKNVLLREMNGRRISLFSRDAPLKDLKTIDQSRRMVSILLRRLTRWGDGDRVEFLTSEDEARLRVCNLLFKLLTTPSKLDRYFLRGSSEEVGATVQRGPTPDQPQTVLVARCHWEGHWREECCSLLDNHISFYPGLEKVLSRVTHSSDFNRPTESPISGLMLVPSMRRCQT